MTTTMMMMMMVAMMLPKLFFCIDHSSVSLKIDLNGLEKSLTYCFFIQSKL